MFEADPGEAGGPDPRSARGGQESYREAAVTSCIGAGQVVWYVPMRQRCSNSRWLLGVVLTMGISLGVPHPNAGATGDRLSAIWSSDPDLTAPAAIVTDTDKRWASSASIPGDGTLLLRTLPTVSKQISVAGTTLVPYIGAGFRGGYVTEVDRSLNTALSAPLSSPGSADVGLKSLAGQMIPNEVQVGIRFPF